MALNIKGLQTRSKCLSCGAHLTVIQGFAGSRFCSPKHQSEHVQELNAAAIQRLSEHAGRLRASLIEIDPEVDIRFS